MQKLLLFILGWLMSASAVCSQNPKIDGLEAQFRNPPASAKPRTWMHAIDGNMSKEGLTKDLEAMRRVGLGGILLFNIDQKIPDGLITYNSPEHHDMLKHAAAECERLGLSFGVHNCDGWSSSGGPWITPEQSMKMVVWNETQTSGGEINMQLPQPTIRENYYQDIAVLAYPALKSEWEDSRNIPIITSSDPDLNTDILMDNRLDSVTTLTKQGKEDAWIQYEYASPHEVRSVFLVFNDRNGEAKLQVSDNGVNFTTVNDLYKVRTGKGEWVINDSFKVLKYKYYRLLLNQTIRFKEAKLCSTQSIHNVSGRISMGRTEDRSMTPIGTPTSEMIIGKDQIVDLSNNIGQNGILKATLPKGNWTIMRLGYTSTGAFNNPASDAGRGLECDKFNREAFKTHYDAFSKKVIENGKKVAPNAMQYVEIDSYEMGGQNWTNGYADIFNKKYGYDIIKFLPLYAGRFVESAAASEAVLWDIRQLNCQLMTDNYFGYFTELCKEDGIYSYIEPYGFGPVNDLDVGGKADINMGEFWMGREMDMVQSAVSASHIYGKTITSAESFTSTPEINWKGTPRMAKASGDLAWTYGINEFMFHRFTHQSNTHVAPGMTMGRWGFHFDRTQPWWDNAGAAWFKYIMRGQLLLRQGVPVSDFLVFVGDGSPNSVYMRKDFEPQIPSGTNFDCVNADVLLNRLSIKGKSLVLPEGTTYRALVLKNCQTLTYQSLKKIYDMAQAGIPVIGEMPEKPAGYLISETDKVAFQETLDALKKLKNVYAGYHWNEMMKMHNMTSDFSVVGTENVPFAHRKIDDKLDIYFFFNANSKKTLFECVFRVDGKIPELWNPMTGEVIKTAQFEQKNGETKVWVNLEAEESVFVVFKNSKHKVPTVTNAEKLKTTSYTVSDDNLLIECRFIDEKVLPTHSNWTVTFPNLKSTQKSFIFPQLIDWVNHSNEDIKYYSGTAVYENTFTLEKKSFGKNNPIILDLGTVHHAAKISINNKELGVLWMPPYQLDVTAALKKGMNTIQIEVTNSWTNRLIGDEQYPNESGFDRTAETMPNWFLNNEPAPLQSRSTFTITDFYGKDKELLPAGLLGPIKIKYYKKVRYK